MPTDKLKNIKYVYLYLVTAITIIMLIIASVNVIKIVLEEYVFDIKGWEHFNNDYPECGVYYYPQAKPVIDLATEKAPELSPEEKEQCLQRVKQTREDQRFNDVKRDLVWSLAMVIVALPLYLYHWRIIKKEK